MGCGLGGGSGAGVAGCTVFFCWAFLSEVFTCTLGSVPVVSGAFGAGTLRSLVLHFVAVVMRSKFSAKCLMALSCSSPIAANGAVLGGCASAAVRSSAAFVAASAENTC
eukprot:12201462-Ditylum_brightwellii.AAC.1